MQILCRDPALGKLGTKLFDYTPLFNFPAPTSKKPCPWPHPTWHGWGEHFPCRKRKRLNVSTRGLLIPSSQKGDSIPPKPNWKHKKPTRLAPQLTLHSGRYWGEGVYIARSLHQRALRVDQLFLNVMKNASQQLPISFSVLLLQIFIWRESFSLWMSVWNMKKGCCHLMWRDESISKRTQHPLLPVPQDSSASQFCAI